MTWDGALGLAQPDPIAAPTLRPSSGRSRPSGSTRKRRRRRRGAGKRLDIQGLRAVAVTAVVLNHLTDHPRGGFVGVDVFFVISGFLITQHLAREHERSGSISIVDFYKRRVRRLFPAALTVVALTVVVGWQVFPAARFAQTLRDAAWAALFSANWRSVELGTNYFSSDGPVSPLQHYWSLAVEEQFYVVWPVALMVVLGLVARARSTADRRAAAGAALAGVLCVVSLAYAYHETSANSVVAYFSTFTRGWELGLGALLAFVVPRLRMPRPVATTLSWAGLVAIGVSLFVTGTDGFPFPGALLPCLGAALVVAATSPGVKAWTPLLTNRVSVYVGDVSYSVYVVHFPVIVFAAALRPDRGWQWYAAVVPVVIGLSVLLFTLVEDPIRRSNWLSPQRETGENVRPEGRTIRTASVTAAVAMVGIVGFSLAAPPTTVSESVLAAVQAEQAARADEAASGGGTTTGPPTPALDALQARLASALTAADWPKLDPEVGRSAAEALGACANEWLPADQCTVGDPAATHTVYLVGDSTSAAYTTAFSSLIGQLPGWKVRSAGGFGCAFAATTLADGDNNNFADTCPDRLRQLLAEVESVRPDLLVVTNVIGTSTYTSSTRDEIAKVADVVGKVVILPAPPRTVDPTACYASGPASCVRRVPQNYSDQWLPAWRAVANSFGGVFIDPTDWYCVNGYCPAFVGTTVMHKDDVHQTTEYAALTAPAVLEAFRNAGLLTSTA